VARACAERVRSSGAVRPACVRRVCFAILSVPWRHDARARAATEAEILREDHRCVILYDAVQP
jgi:hypothetical protein